MDGDTLWTEWHTTRTRTDGTEFDARGVAIWEVEDGLLRRGRIYVEPVGEADAATWEEFYAVGGGSADGE